MSTSLEHESFVAKIVAIINERLQSSASSELQKMFTSKIEVLNSAPFHYTESKDPCYQSEEPSISFNSPLSWNLRSPSLRFFNDENSPHTSSFPTHDVDDISNTSSFSSEASDVVRHLQPDSQWRFEGAKLSSIVLEVAKSQSYDSLETKAKQFISDSNGEYPRSLALCSIQKVAETKGYIKIVL